MRATDFGALWFIDHVEITYKGYAYVVLVIIDAMSNLLIVQTQPDKKESSTTETLKLTFTTWNVRPGNVCADDYFMTPSWRRWYHFQGINPIPLGPHTPWPNRAEAGVRQFSIRAKILLESIEKMSHKNQSYAQCQWRNLCKMPPTRVIAI